MQLSTNLGSDTRDGRRSIVRAFEVICRGPLARSTLRNVLKTSPSTVTLSVQALRERGLVVETETGGPTGGRRPKILDLAPTLGGVLAVDVGGINLRMAAANMRAEILAKTVVSTPGSFEQVGAALRAGLAQVRASVVGPVRAIAVAVPGVVDPASGRIANIENLPGWRTDELQRVLAEFDAPIVIENEANLAAFGEHRLGGARDAESVLFVALGAGIGAGVIIRGDLFRGATGAAGEIGYLRATHDGEAATLEQDAGADAVVRRYRSYGGRDSIHTAEAVFGLAQSGERAAQLAVDDVIAQLTLGIANAIVVLNPKIVVLGGGLAEAGEMLLVPLRKSIAPLVPSVPDLRLSDLGQDAALMGAASIAAEHARSLISLELDAIVA